MLPLRKSRRGGTAGHGSELKATKQTQNVWSWIGLWFGPKGKSENWIYTEYLDKTRELLLVNNESESGSVKLNSFWPHELYSPWNSPGQNTGVDSLSLFQGIFPTQGSSPGLPHCRQILYQLSHQGSPRILEWVAYPFSSGSSRPRNQTGVSCIAGGFLTNWATRLIMYTCNCKCNDGMCFLFCFFWRSRLKNLG